MRVMSILKNLTLFALGNPLCDGLEKRVAICKENLAIQQELLAEEQKLLQEEEKVFKRVTELQNTLLSKFHALKEAKNRTVLVLGDEMTSTGKLDQITEIATLIVEQLDVNHQDLVDDMAKLKESVIKLDAAKVEMGQTFRSSEKIKMRG